MDERDHQPRGRKRVLPRLILSCLECRRKKLKCDRSLPSCDQCQRRRTTARCAYDAHEQEVRVDCGATRSSQGARKKPKAADSSGSGLIIDNQDTSAADARLGVVEELQARVGKLERLLSTEHCYPREDEHGVDCKAHGVLTIKETVSRYHSSDQKLPVFLRFNEAVHFLHNLFNNPNIDSGTKEFIILRKAIVKSRVPVTAPLSSANDMVEFMKSILPAQEVCDNLVAIYFDNFEVYTRVLHRPSFRAKCLQLWRNLEEPDKYILPQLLGVVLIASRLGDGGFTYIPTEGSVSVESVFRVLMSWISALSSKQRMETSVLQTQCLILLARRLYPSERDLSVTDSAALVRSAMIMGLHRDPKEFPKISTFRGEIRRRLWMTIIELDLRNCLAEGIPPTTRNGEFTTSLPAEVCDDDLYENMARPPRRKEATASACLHSVLSDTFQLRLDAVESTNNTLKALGSGEILKCVCVLKSRLAAFRDVQEHLHPFSGGPEKDGIGQDFNTVLIIIHIHRSIISMCREHIFQHVTNETTRKLEEICIESSLDILSLLHLFSPTDSAGKRNRYFDLFHVLCHSEIVQATLLLCLALKSMNSSSISSNDFGCSDDTTLSRATLVMAAGDAVDSLMHRNAEPANDIRDPLCFSVVLQSVRAKVSQEEMEALMQEGASKVIKICRQRFNSTFSSHIPCLVSNNNIASPETAQYQSSHSLQPNNMYIPLDLEIEHDQLGIESMEDFDSIYDWDWHGALT